MSDSNVLMDAISCVDDKYLQKYFSMKEKRQLKKNIKFSALIPAAACLSLVIGISILFITKWMQVPDPGPGPSIGIVAQQSIGTLTYIGCDEIKKECTFILNKTDDTPIYFKFSGAIVTDEWVNDNGQIVKNIQEIDVITPYDDYIPDDGHMLMDIDLTIYINGNISDFIPVEAGIYEVTIDYSKLYETLDIVYNNIDVYKFGNFLIEDN